ncbi:MAG: DUF177 domain-containing protein [Cryomorphaceae bacterium]|nr:MAG: DUF177 domain-containing protein [Cryomorphaceae bacterium]
MRSFCEPLIEIVVNWKRTYIIQFEGLKEGLHHYEFEVNDTFFASIEGSLVEQGNFEVSLKLEKKSTLMEFDFSGTGVIRGVCDRCGDPLDFSVSWDKKLIVKYGNPGDETSDDLVFIPHNAYEIDMAPFIYELIVLAIPRRNVHEDGQCNEEALRLLDELNAKNDDVDPRWSKLTDLNSLN